MLFSVPKLTTMLPDPGHVCALPDVGRVLYWKIIDAFDANVADRLPGRSRGGKGGIRSIRLRVVASVHGR